MCVIWCCIKTGSLGTCSCVHSNAPCREAENASVLETAVRRRRWRSPWAGQTDPCAPPRAGERHRENVLQGIAASLEGWAVQVKREKAVYHTLNKFSVDVMRKAPPPRGSPGRRALRACPSRPPLPAHRPARLRVGVTTGVPPVLSWHREK